MAPPAQYGAGGAPPPFMGPNTQNGAFGAIAPATAPMTTTKLHVTDDTTLDRFLSGQGHRSQSTMALQLLTGGKKCSETVRTDCPNSPDEKKAELTEHLAELRTRIVRSARLSRCGRVSSRTGSFPPLFGGAEQADCHARCARSRSKLPPDQQALWRAGSYSTASLSRFCSETSNQPLCRRGAGAAVHRPRESGGSSPRG